MNEDAKHKYNIKSKGFIIGNEKGMTGKNAEIIAEAMGSMDIKPGMKFSCMYCSERHEPYIHMVNHDYAHFGFCNDLCYMRYHSWFGALKRVYDEITRWLWHKPKYFIIDSYYNTKLLYAQIVELN